LLCHPLPTAILSEHRLACFFFFFFFLGPPPCYTTFVYFEFPLQAGLDPSAPIYASCNSCDDLAQLLVEMGSCELFAKTGLKPWSSWFLLPK
jgi:hypothetical protein